MSDQHQADDKVKMEEEIQEEERVDAENQEVMAETEPAETEIVQEEEQREETTADETVEALQKKLIEAEQKAEENYQKYLRAQADFDNFRRRTRKENETVAKYASQTVIEQLIPALDNFERAIAASKETTDLSSLIKGLEMVFGQVEQVLEQEGVTVIPAVGETFDPTIHQAVMQVESDEYSSGTVIEELQKGYKLKDRVIRPAMVKVSQ